MSKDDLKPKHGRGRTIKTSEWNAVVALLLRSGYLSAGIDTGNGVASRIQSTSLVHLFGKCAEAVDPYSVLSAKDTGAGTAEPLMVEVEKSTSDNSLVLFTNENSKIPADGQAEIRVIGVFPTRIQVTGTVPVPGEECGPESGTFGISLDGAGLLCLAVEEAEDYAWVVSIGGSGDNARLVKTTVAHSAGATETVEVWDGPGGSETVSDPLVSFDTCNRTDIDIAAGVFCLAHKLKGVWYIEPWGCG
jgi:hypothetical protein